MAETRASIDDARRSFTRSLASPAPLSSPQGSRQQNGDDDYSRARTASPTPLGFEKRGFQDGPPQPIHRFERLLVVRAAPTKAFRDIIGSMSMLRPVAGPLQVQSLAPPEPQSSYGLGTSTHGSSFGAVAEASVGGQDLTTSTQAAPTSTTSESPSAMLAPPPSARSRSTSLDTDDDQASVAASVSTAGGLSRSASVRSTRSTRSASSIASNASGASSRRVYPVYNLEFHALHHSVVVDAVTEERVARVHKRGIEITDFAMLDPVIHGQHYSIPTYAQRLSDARKAAAAARAESSGHDFRPANLINRFKRFSLRVSSMASNTASGDALPKRASLLRPSNSETSTVSGLPVVPLFREKAAPGDLADADASHAARHAPGYVWVVESLLRKDLIEAADQLCDITIEWRKRRGRPTRRQVDPTQRRTQSAAASRRNSVVLEDADTPGAGTPSTIGPLPGRLTIRAESPSAPRDSASFDRSRPTSAMSGRDSPQLQEQTRADGALAARLLSPNRLSRPATAPHHPRGRTPLPRSDSPSPSMGDAPSVSNMSHTDGDGDSGEESDPEDSEKPWICELVVKKPQGPYNAAPMMQRILLGTVTPAPHHPRLVAHLAIPLTLSPVNIDTRGPMDIHAISPEEMKDIMTVTALWLIVREGLGLSGVKARRQE